MVMRPSTTVTSPARLLRLPWWLWRPSRRRRARENFHFWGLVHNEDWLQYDPREKYR